MRRCAYLSQLVFLFVALSAFAQVQPKTDALAIALEAFNAGRFLEAIQGFKTVAASDHRSGLASFFLSRIYTEMGALESAERYLGQALSADPAQAIYYEQLGRIRSRQRRWHDAITLYERALKMGGASEASLWRSIGDAHSRLFERDAALEAFERALQQDPNDAQTHLTLGQFYLERNEPKKALVELRRTVDLNPALPGALSSLGRAYRRLDDLGSAVKMLSRALELDPADQDARYALGQTFLSLDRIKEGQAQLAQYREISDQVVAADRSFEAARKARSRGELPEAEKLFRQSVNLAPSYSPALAGLGEVLLASGKSAEAVRFLELAETGNPLNAETQRYLGEAYFLENRLEDALEATQRAILLDEQDADAHRLLQRIYSRPGQASRKESPR